MKTLVSEPFTKENDSLQARYMLQCRTANSLWCNNMDDLAKTPVMQELLVRIEKLEDQNKRLVDLSLKLAQQVGNLINQFGTMDMHFIEIADKVFPGYRETQRQIMEICTAIPQETDGSRE